MSKIQILTDSTSDLSADMIAEDGIHIIPLTVHFGEETFKDGVDINGDEFYKLLQTHPEHPKTSQPSPADFKQKYLSLLEDGSEIISIHISSKMSGTMSSAMAAKKEIGSDKIHIIDSKMASLALGQITRNAAKAVKKGQTIDEVLNIIDTNIDNMQVYFIVDTLEFLHKGGRIGKASEIIGGLLNIKPILTIIEGQVCPHTKVRGAKKVFSTLSSMISNYQQQTNNVPIDYTFAHGGTPELIEKIAETVKSQINMEDAQFCEIGPVIGAHTGPGMLAICMSPRIL
jgi:DegV family protein with EDD domain